MPFDRPPLDAHLQMACLAADRSAGVRQVDLHLALLPLLHEAAVLDWQQDEWIKDEYTRVSSGPMQLHVHCFESFL